MNTTKATIGLLSAAIMFFSCKKDNPSTPETPTPVTPSVSKKVYVVNEGNFNSSNASISLYDPATGNITEDYYKTQNGSGVGDVAQSMNYINSKFYIVVNNSSKVVVCDNQLKKTAEISGLTSPRYILKINDEKAYISDMYSNAISVINLSDNTKTSDIALGSSSETMVLANNKVFVTTYNYPSTKYAYVIDAASNTKADSIDVGLNATNIVIDKNNKIWVLGNKLSRINPETNAVEASWEVSNTNFSYKLCLNKTKDTLYFLNDNIYRMSISDNALPTSTFIEKGSKSFYGMGVNPNDYTIYATDALDYTQKANVYIFNSNGTELKNFKAGVVANGFYFE